MATAQSELSMDEILASIRRIIHEEEEPQARQPADSTNTVDLQEKKKAAAAKPAPAKPAPKPAGKKIAAKAEAPAATAHPAPNSAPATTLGDALLAQDILQKTASEPSPTDEPFQPVQEMRNALPSADQVAEEVKKAAPAPAPAETTPAAIMVTEKQVNKELPMAEAVTQEPEIKTATVVETPAAEEPPVISEPAAAASEAELTDQAVKSLMGSVQTDQVSSAFSSLKKNVQVASSGGPSLESMVEAMLRPMLKEWLDANLPAIVEAKVEAEIKRISER